MTSAPQRKRNKRWILAALIAAIIFLGEVAVEVLSDDLKRILEPYRIYVWSMLALAFVAAIIMAIKESRAEDGPNEEKPQSERNISADKVKNSILVTGDDNVIANHTQGDVIGGDKITDVDADGDFVQRDKIVHIHQPTIPALSPLNQLSAPPHDFTGRKEEIEDLLANFQKGVAISGLRGQGGVGKTALALKLAEIIKDRYPDAQFYLDLRGVSANPLSSADAMAHVIRAYHPTAKLPESEAELSAIYHSLLHDKRALILMDNAKDRRQVEPLIPPACCVLIVTSRQHFTLPGIYDKDLDALPLEDARKFLLRIAKRIGDAADEIARLCGQLPLALRVAASAIAERENLSPDRYVRRLKDAKQRLSHLKEVDIVLNESCELLDEESRRRWRMLAVFAKTFDESAAAAVWEMEADGANDAPGNLLTYSLIEYDATSSRYSLHDLARIFADGRLSDSERDAAKRRYAPHYCQTLEQVDALYEQGGEAIKRGLDLFDLERANIEAGWAWAESLSERDEEAARLCIKYPDAGRYALNLRQHSREWIRWIESQLAAARKLKKRDYEGYALGNLGVAYRDLGEARKAIEFFEQVLVIAREIDDWQAEGTALGNLGLAYFVLGETRKAIEFYEQALVIDRKIDDRRDEGYALDNLGVAYRDLGETRKAIEFFEQQIEIAREIGDQRSEGTAVGNLGGSYFLLGETRKAIEFCEQALAVLRELGGRMGEGTVLGNLGLAYAALGETRKAIEFYERALAIAREIGDQQGEGRHLWNICLIFDKLGERARTIECAVAALKIFEEIESPYAEQVRNQLAEWRQSDEK